MKLLGAYSTLAVSDKGVSLRDSPLLVPGRLYTLYLVTLRSDSSNLLCDAKPELALWYLEQYNTVAVYAHHACTALHDQVLTGTCLLAQLRCCLYCYCITVHSAAVLVNRYKSRWRITSKCSTSTEIVLCCLREVDRA